MAVFTALPCQPASVSMYAHLWSAGDGLEKRAHTTHVVGGSPLSVVREEKHHHMPNGERGTSSSCTVSFARPQRFIRGRRGTNIRYAVVAVPGTVYTTLSLAMWWWWWHCPPREIGPEVARNSPCLSRRSRPRPRFAAVLPPFQQRSLSLTHTLELSAGGGRGRSRNGRKKFFPRREPTKDNSRRRFFYSLSLVLDPMSK